MSPRLTVCLLVNVLLLTGLALVPGPAAAQTRYVSDELVITFRTQPSTRGEILRHLPSGARLEMLEAPDDSEWARVRISSGQEGWVRKQYLMNEPIAADRLEAANREVEQLSRTVADLRQRLENVQGARTEAEQSTSTLTARVSQLQEELSEIKRVSAGAIETARENQRLKELNARLRDELNALVAERDRLAEGGRQRWLMIGGGLVLAGLFLGMILKSRPRRSAWT